MLQATKVRFELWRAKIKGSPEALGSNHVITTLEDLIILKLNIWPDAGTGSKLTKLDTSSSIAPS